MLRRPIGMCAKGSDVQLTALKSRGRGGSVEGGATPAGPGPPAARSDISRCGDKTAAAAATRAHLPDFRGPPRSRNRRRRSWGPGHLQQGPTSVDVATKRQRLRPIGLTSPTSGGLRGREGDDGPPPAPRGWRVPGRSIGGVGQDGLWYRGQPPGPFRRVATCGPSTGSVYGRVRWVSPVNAAPTASGSETDSTVTKSFIAVEEFSPRLAAASPAGPALHSPMPGCGRCP